MTIFSTLRALLKTMRPRQWAKNAFIFPAIIFDGQMFHIEALLRTAAAFVLFCLISSAVYIVNDIKDIESDRRHPVKKNRPLPSGKLSIRAAVTGEAAILLVTLPLSYWLSPFFFLICLAYYLLNLAYSFKLKHIVLIDVLILASGFVLRVAGGVVVINVQRFSPWLYVVTTLLALYIGFGKRRAEVALLAEGVSSIRPVLDGYTLPLVDQIITIVSSTTIIAYSLYTFSAPNLPQNHEMMLTIPIVIYGIFRYLYLIQVEHRGGAPEELFLHDRPLQITFLLYGLSVLLTLYIK